MRVYTLRADYNKYRGLYYLPEDIVEFNRRFDGASMKNTWTGAEAFSFIPEKLPKGDTPGFSTHIPVLSSRAVAALSDLLEENGELLPIACDKEDYYLFNVTRVVDALDESNCELDRFPNGRIMDVVRYSFFPDKLEGVNVFKIPQAVLMDVFVTDLFVQRVKTAGLGGFKFREVWRSDR